MFLVGINGVHAEKTKRCYYLIENEEGFYKSNIRIYYDRWWLAREGFTTGTDSIFGGVDFGAAWNGLVTWVGGVEFTNTYVSAFGKYYFVSDVTTLPPYVLEYLKMIASLLVSLRIIAR